MSQITLQKKQNEKATRKKYKFSERDERFACNRQNHRKSEEACDRRYSREIREKFHLKCKSKEQKNKSYLKHCRDVEQKYKTEKKRNNPNAYQDRMLGLKRCEICLDPVNNEFLLYCNICEDGYHCYCIKPPVLDLEEIEPEEFTCEKCLNMQQDNTGKYRQTTMDESFHFTIRKNQKKCFDCGLAIKEKLNYFAPSIEGKMNKAKNSQRSKKNMIRISLKSFEESTEEGDEDYCGNKEEEFNSIKSCTRCKKDFHNECFFKKIYNSDKRQASKPKKNNDDGVNNSKSKSKYLKSATNYNANNNEYNNMQSKNICRFCEEKIKKDTESMKISDFFKYHKNPNSNLNSACKGKNPKSKESDKTESADKAQNNSNNNQANDIVMFDFEEKKNENVAHYPKFILWKPLPTQKIELLKENLKNALIFKNIEFSDDLAFLDEECPGDMNNAKLEPGIQKMSTYNKTIYYKFKERTRRGEFPGLEIIEDPIQGHIVKAVEDIKKHTLICEYTGEVCLLRKKLFDTTNDSIMELIRHPSSSSSLVICPEKKGNIARFLSGINNADKKAKKKQNVNSARYDIDGKVHVLLYASKAIKKGEVLYYDYNAGGSGTYPTENFV